MSAERFSAALVGTLRDALIASFWFKSELRAFLTTSLGRRVVEGYDWALPKRDIVVMALQQLEGDLLVPQTVEQAETTRVLIRGVLELRRYAGLEKLDDAAQRIAQAKQLQRELAELLAAHERSQADAHTRAERQALHDEYERRRKEDADRKRQRDDDDALRAANPVAYYGRILGLKGKVGRDDVRACYRARMAEYHPDRFHHLDQEFVRLATERAQRIGEAYEFICKRFNIQK